MIVDWHPDALAELLELEVRERNAIRNAVRRLGAAGSQLGYPHSSAVKSATGTLRELRPRQGRSRWRAFYRRLGERLVVPAIGPEAGVDAAGFDRAVATALERLAEEERHE